MFFQLLQFLPDVVITAHRGFFSCNALENIATITLTNITEVEQGKLLKYGVVYQSPASTEADV